jgi:3-dehydroquinate synthase
MMENSATRNSHLIVKGGGLLMDLGAFSASIYMRGIKHLTLIPTTLLGMVDATVGGKTATNYANTKNLIGTIRNANHIIVYPQFTYTQT